MRPTAQVFVVDTHLRVVEWNAMSATLSGCAQTPCAQAPCAQNPPCRSRYRSVCCCLNPKPWAARVPSGGCQGKRRVRHLAPTRRVQLVRGEGRDGVLRRGGGRYEREAMIGKDILDVGSGQSRPVYKQVTSLEPPCKRGERVGWERSGSRAL